jgi:hypothetical protein
MGLFLFTNAVSNSDYDHAIAEEVSRRLSTAAVRLQLLVVACDVCGGQSITAAGFLRVLRFSHSILILPTAPHSTIYHGLYSKPYSDRRATVGLKSGVWSVAWFDDTEK